MKKFARFLLIVTMVPLLVACGNTESQPASDDSLDNEKASSVNLVENPLLGYYECTGSDMQGTKLDPEGEWLELKADGTGAWFLGATENAFDWTQEGKNLSFKLDVGLDYKATIEDDEIVLDTGMLYYFRKAGAPEAQTTDNQVDRLGIAPAGSITFPSDWYGVAIITDCVNVDFYDDQFDIWATIDKDSNGDAYFEIYFGVGEEFVNKPLLSMYIDEEEVKWLTPKIGVEDAWLNAVYLTKDDEWAFLTEYDEGALDIYYTYDDEGKYADYRFFIREYGTAWDEEIDPLPQGYAAYTAEFYGTSNKDIETSGLDDITIDPKDIEISFGSNDYGKDGRVYTSTGSMEMKIPEGWEVETALHDTTIGVRSSPNNGDVIKVYIKDYSSMIKDPANRSPENQAKEVGPSDVSLTKDKWGNTDVWYYLYEWSDYTTINGFAAYDNEQYVSFDIRAKIVNGTVEDFMKSDAWNTLRTTFKLTKP